MAASALVLSGCGITEIGDSAAKSYEDYRKEAQQEITAENAEQELEKIEQSTADR